MHLFFRKKEGWILDRQLTVSAIVVFQIHAFISDFLVLFDLGVCMCVCVLHANTLRLFFF